MSKENFKGMAVSLGDAGLWARRTAPLVRLLPVAAYSDVEKSYQTLKANTAHAQCIETGLFNHLVEAGIACTVALLVLAAYLSIAPQVTHTRFFPSMSDPSYTQQI